MAGLLNKPKQHDIHDTRGCHFSCFSEIHKTSMIISEIPRHHGSLFGGLNLKILIAPQWPSTLGYIMSAPV